MPMPPYEIVCQETGCGKPARYKIAARWSDGIIAELKTYSLACDGCLPKWFQESLVRRSAYRLAKNEVLESPGIYRLERGQRDVELERLNDLENRLLADMHTERCS